MFYLFQNLEPNASGRFGIILSDEIMGSGKSSALSDLFAKRFVKNKKLYRKNGKVDMKAFRKAVYREEEDVALTPLAQETMQKFASCYMLMAYFLELYLERRLHIKTSGLEGLFQRCLQMDLITNDEAEKMFAISNELHKFLPGEEPIITFNMLECGVLINHIFKRLKANF